MTDLFADTHALVTGASSGLGAEFARQLAARGAHLILTARRKEQLDALAGELRAAHRVQVDVIAHDLGAPGAAAILCEAVDRLGHPVRHLINNAGFGSGGPFRASDGARQAEMVRLNCEALVTLSHHFLPRLLDARAGGIVHVASVAGMQPVPYMAVYGATKAFVLSFSLALSEEAREAGVRVLALCPGPVPTGFQKASGLGTAPSQRRAVLSAEETVRRGLEAYARGKALLVPGRLNKLGSVGSKLLPRTTLARMVGRMMKQKGRA